MVLTFENSILPGMKTKIEKILMSHTSDITNSFGITEKCHVTIIIGRENFCQLLEEKKYSELKIGISNNTALEIICNAEVMQVKNGLVTIPTVYCLYENGVLDYLNNMKSDSPVSLLSIANNMKTPLAKNLIGNLYGALKIMVFQGWLRLNEKNNNTTFYLTDQGKELLVIIKENKSIINRVVDSIKWIRSLESYFFDETLTDCDEKNAFVFLVNALKSKLLKNIGDDNGRNRIRIQIYKYLDGIITVHIFFTLDALKVNIKDSKKSLMDLLLDYRNNLDIKKMPLFFDFKILKTALNYLVFKELLFCPSHNKYCFTELGETFSKFYRSCGTTLSYMNIYENLNIKLFSQSNSSVHFSDENINRSINLKGSTFNSSGISHQICKNIIRNLFSTPSIHDQPIGITDMGCGDGNNLSIVIDYILNSTKRGKILERCPLYIVGSDCSEISIKMTKKTLLKYNGIPGIHIAVFKGNVSDPEFFFNQICCNKTWSHKTNSNEVHRIKADDFVHMQMFVSHQRELSLHERKDALDIINNQIHKIPKKSLISLIMEASDHQITDLTLKKEIIDFILNQINGNYSLNGCLVPTIVILADYVQFLMRWGKVAKHGLIIVEFHITDNYDWLNAPPKILNGWMRCDKIGNVASWGTHYISNQYPLSYFEHRIALALAGFYPMNNHLYGGHLIPRSIPYLPLISKNWDKVPPQYKYYSFACFKQDTC